jgi:prepilin-type N-terminal cleavage/methylation domain-containing protein
MKTNEMAGPTSLARRLLYLPAEWEGTVEDREKGFSLIELMVAMVVTLIISGAVFQLVTAGQSAFKKEPAVADRQQNIPWRRHHLAGPVPGHRHAVLRPAHRRPDGFGW